MNRRLFLPFLPSSLAFARLGLVGLVASAAACGTSKATPAIPSDAGPVAPSVASGSAPADGGRATAKSEAPGKAATGSFADWIRARLPHEGDVREHDGKMEVSHAVAEGDTALSIAKKYLDLTDVYFATDLAREIVKANPDVFPEAADVDAKAAAPGKHAPPSRFDAGVAGRSGARVTIPHLLAEPYKDPEHDRLGWPTDKALRGIFITGANASVAWPQTIEHMGARVPAMNAIVLDGKDYEGPITYPTKVKVALDNEASTAPWPGHEPPIPDLARAIRFAHAKGVRIIIRIACFHDPWTAKHTPELSVQADWGKPFTMGWLDPVNENAQNYIIDLAKEAMEAGADEIQLDYVRFPVHGGLKHAIFPPGHGGKRINAIRDFVRRVHEVTKPRGVPLSLDIFGVTATGERGDIEMLGQDIAVLGHECEALSPMVYPSHYDAGYHGFEVPGAHAEIVGIGTKGAMEHLKEGHATKECVIRSWLQASSYKTPNYGPQYLVDEATSAEKNGGVGWLMWSPSNDYNAAWRGFPPTKQN